ncbi:MAG: insulinase family protein [Deltaproteobacteria bacterium]|nr:insulinase family protein [Deltaproteobacteria bacterium]
MDAHPRRMFTLALWLLPALAAAQVDLRSAVKQHVLRNGMTWLVVERHQAPVFTGFVRVKVGGADEEAGYTGLAHLFEHMAFKGTAALGTTDFEAEKGLLRKIAEAGDRLSALERSVQGATEEAARLRTELKQLGEAHGKLTDENALSALYQLNGAVGLNATTDKDLTSYFVSFPRNRLELWAQVEASRLAAPVLRDFYKERDVVMEERRMRTDSEPGGAMYEELMQVAFTMSPYRWPTVGYMGDLESMTLQRAQAFHEKFYAPANAVGCIVGDVKFEEVVPLLERTFGAIPARPAPPPLMFAEPPRRQQRRSTVYFDAGPRLMLGFRKPTLPSRDDYVFDVIDAVLGEGRTGRLHQRLVQKDRVAQRVGVFTGPGSRLDNLFTVVALPMEGVPLEKVERAAWEELERLKREPLAAEELQKVLNQVQAGLARAVATNNGLASTLSRYQALAGDWRYFVDHPGVIASITAEDVQRVARQYFVPENAVVVDLQRPAAAGGGK